MTGNGAADIRSVVVSVDGVLGWWFGARFVRGRGQAVPVSGGETYTIVGLDGTSTAIGSPPGPGCGLGDPEPVTIDVGLEYPEDRLAPLPIAVTGVPDPAPRPVVDLASQAAYVQAAVAALADLGVDDPSPELVQLLRTDFEGDGVDEVLIVAERLSDPDTLFAQPGDYSVLLLRQVVDEQVTTVVAESVADPGPDETPFVQLTRVGAAADLDGDGTMELVTSGVYYEGAPPTPSGWTRPVASRRCSPPGAAPEVGAWDTVPPTPSETTGGGVAIEIPGRTEDASADFRPRPCRRAACSTPPRGRGGRARGDRCRRRHRRPAGPPQPPVRRHGQGAPGSVVLKMPSQFPENRAIGDHFNFYEREGRFYQQISDKLGVRTPQCYWNHIDTASGTFALLLEDLGSRTMISQIAGVAPGGRCPPVSGRSPRRVVGVAGDRRVRLDASPRRPDQPGGRSAVPRAGRPSSSGSTGSSTAPPSRSVTASRTPWRTCCSSGSPKLP